MNKLFLSFLFLFFSVIIFAQNGLECLVVEKYYISDANDTTANGSGGRLPVGSVTYRLYADMLPGYKFQAAYGLDVAPTGTIGAGDHELRIETSTLFFNNEDRGATNPNFTKSRCADNTVMLDSWLSVGAAAIGNFGILKSLDNGVSNVNNGDGVLQNNDAAAGIPLTTQDGLIAGTTGTFTEVGLSSKILVFDNQNDGTNGPLFSTYDGSWACLGGCTGPDTTDNKLLIAQITTDGIFSFELNIQIGTPSGGVERYVARNPVGPEIMLPCLMDTFGVPAVPPTVAITAPAGGTIYHTGDTVHIAASAASASGTIKNVEFFVDGTSIGVDSISPYQADWITTDTGSYDLTATATDNDGGQTTSTIVAITVQGPSGIDDMNSLIPVFTVVPNPSKGIVQLQIPSTGSNAQVSYDVRDLEGRMIIQKNIGAINGNRSELLDISTCAGGLYFVQVTVNGFTATRKIIKD